LKQEARITSVAGKLCCNMETVDENKYEPKLYSSASARGRNHGDGMLHAFPFIKLKDTDECISNWHKQAKLKALGFLYPSEVSEDCALLSSFGDD